MRVQARRLGIALAAATLAACAGFGGGAKTGPEPGSRGEGRPSPPIRNITKEKAPDEKQLPIIKSEEIAPDPDKALANYKKLLELAPDEETKAEAERRLADLQVQVDDLKGGTEDNGASLKNSIKIYETLLKERPGDPKNDRVLYQLSRAQQNVGDSEAAIATLKKLTDEYASSPLAGDAHFRRADLLYRLDRYAESESEYQTVMGYSDRTPFYEPAQYMMGWSQYRQSRYDAAIKTFFDILDRELPEDPVPLDVEEALAAVEKGKTDLARDSLRVVSLSFSALGGGAAVSESFQKNGNPRFYPLVYNALGSMLLEKQRYNDAADAYAAFTKRYPTSPLAPTFQSSVIDAYKTGGFTDLVIREKERYAVTYDPSAPYWGGKPATPEVMTALRGHLEDLARNDHTIAQANPVANRDKYLEAAKWYRRIIDLYPQDKDVAEIDFLLGDALLDGGKTLDAAQEYTNTAYKYPPHKRSGEAAYAAFLAYEKNAKEVPPAERPKALRNAVDAAVKLADTFNQHSERLAVLTQAAQDLYEMKALDESISVASRVLKSPTPAPDVLRRNAWSVTGDAQFALKHYPESEVAYGEELKLTPGPTPEHGEVVEQLAASIYKQGEAARDAGDLKKSVNDFLRVGKVTPDSKIRANADYDAAASLVTLKDWPNAEQVLESFRQRFPTNQLTPDVDKKLAVAYSSDNKPAQAAAVFERIAVRPNESDAVRREAAWQAPQLYDTAKMPVDASRAYQSYVTTYPRPVERSMQARVRLVEIARSRNDVPLQIYWHNQIVSADEQAGAERTDATRTLAANSSLEIGRFSAADAKRIRLTAPLDKSLPQKKAAMETAIAALNRAIGYNFADTTTAGTYELGALYQDFGKSITDSDRPGNLKDLELEQYNLLLEEQSFPFEEKAIQAYEANVKRILQGRYDTWIKQSAQQLTVMAPGKYGKREQSEDVYESLN